MASHKPGYITASMCGKVLTGAKAGTPIKGTLTQINKLAWEIMCVKGLAEYDQKIDGFEGNRFTEYGNEIEPMAIAEYQRQRFPARVKDQQSGIVHPELPLSCTPDGIVYVKGVKDRMMEVKTVTKGDDWIDLHENGTKSRVTTHWDQCQHQMMLAGVDKCDLVLYNPRVRRDKSIIITEIRADPKWQEFAMERYRLVFDMANSIVGRMAT